MRSTKFLGVFIDEHLNFKCHIDQLMLRLSKYVGLFYKIRHYLPQATLLVLYRTLVEPHLDYCNVIWCNTYPTHLTKPEILQKKIIRAISWSKPDAESRPLFHRFGLLKVPEYNKYLNACLIYQVVHRLNTRLCELVPIRYPQHSYDIRVKDHLTGKDRKLTCTRHSVVYSGLQIWNKLDDSLKKVRSLSSFKKHYKKQLLSLYE